MVVAAVARTAYASPLEPLWSVPYKGSCDAAMFASNGGLVLARGKEVVAVDAKTGKQGPPRALAAKIDPARAELVAGMVIAAADDGLRAYDATTGAAAWSSLTPAIAAFTKDAVLVAGTSDIRLVDARTGSARWTVALKSGPSVAANVDDARAYIATQAPGSDAVVTAYSLADGKTAWTMHASSMYTGHKAAIDAVAAGEGIVLAEIASEGLLGLDAATGKQQWAIRGALGAFVVRDGRVFAGPGASPASA